MINILLYLLSAVILVGFVLSGIRIIRPTERGLVERFGKYHKFANAGFYWIIPVIDRLIKVNITESLADVKPQDIITKDNLNARVDLMVYYKVRPDEVNVKRSVYNVENFVYQIVSLAQTTARNVIGDMKFIDVNNKRNILNVSLAEVLDKESDAWGVQIVRVELKEITPPSDVQATMNMIIKANNEKEAATDFATASETRADGERRAEIKKAEGIGKSKRIIADANAYKIQIENEAAEKYFVGNAQKLKALEVTLGSLENNTKIVLTEKGINPTIILGNIPTKEEK